MKTLTPLVAASLPALFALSGCATIFDPSPYVAYQDPRVQDGSIAGPPPPKAAPGETAPPANPPAYYDAQALLYFKSYADASPKLARLSLGYGRARNTLMREQLLFDVPAIGLGVASITSLAFRGAADATTGLALAAASVTGSRTYFQPSAKIKAYNSAALSLECASVAAHALGEAWRIFGYSSLATSIDTNSAEAADIVQNAAAATGIDKPALMAARDAAQKAVGGLRTAIATVEAGPTKLQSFADATIRKATSTVVTGAPSADSVVAAIRSSLGASTSPDTSSGAKASSTPTPSAFVGDRSARSTGDAKARALLSAQQLTATLKTNAAEAEHNAQMLNDAWAEFTACAAIVT